MGVDYEIRKISISGKKGRKEGRKKGRKAVKKGGKKGGRLADLRTG